ncbi:MAG: endonuclease/exonuclease/phosphatase family protein [Chloroflexota bacterium]
MNKRKQLWLIILGILVVGLAFTRRATVARNYHSPSGPKFVGHYTADTPTIDGTVTVVSYNIKYGQNIDQAIQELGETQSLANADIILLQEMDETATDQLAQARGYNFVYFPAAIHPIYQKNFGNAILSKWPIRDAEKLVLPHKSLTRSMNRQATKAIVSIGDTDILVYSVHAETAASVPRFRWNQYQAIADDVKEEATHVIVGGDFNTITMGEVDQLDTLFLRANLPRVSTDIGHTVNKFSVDMPMDHIFTRGFSVTSAGKVSEATASDHLPIWVKLEIE